MSTPPPRTKKKKAEKRAKTKKKSNNNNRSDSNVASVRQVKKWLHEDKRFKGHKLKSTTDPKLNYYCGICDKFRKATCKNDMFKHVDTKLTNSKHSKKKREQELKQQNKDKPSSNNTTTTTTTTTTTATTATTATTTNNNNKITVQITDINNRIQDTRYDFYLSALTSNLPAQGILNFCHKFIYKKRRVRFSSGLPRSKATFTQAMPSILTEYENVIQKKMKVFIDDPFFHFAVLMDEGTNNGDALMAILTATNSWDKPTFTHGDFLQNSSNSVAVCDSFQENLAFLEYNRKNAVLLLVDDVKYNETAFDGIKSWCPFIEKLICPLHGLGNSKNDLMDHSLLKLAKKIITEGPKLFKNSADRRKSWKEFRQTQSFENDNLIVDFFNNLPIAQIREIYGIPDKISNESIELRVKEIIAMNKKNKNVIVVERKQNEEEKEDEKKKSLVESYLPNNILSSPPPREIKNKWLVIVFVIFWWTLNLHTFIKWVFQYFDREYYFMELSPSDVQSAQAMFAYLLYFVISRYLPLVIKFQSRGPLFHIAYDKFNNFIDYYKDLTVTKSQLLKLQLSKVKQDNILTQTDIALRDSFKSISKARMKKLTENMNTLNKYFYSVLKKRFSNNSRNMLYYKASKYLHPSCEQQCENIKEATHKMKNGSDKFANDHHSYSLFEREYTYYKEIVCPLYKQLKIAIETKTPLILSSDENDNKDNDNKENENEENENEENENNQIVEKLSVINNVELTNLLNKLLKDDDIIYFWRHIPKMEMLNLYSVKTLDNPFCDVEVERLMNYFKWLSSDLNKQMGPITKLARLYAMWNYDILVK